MGHGVVRRGVGTVLLTLSLVTYGCGGAIPAAPPADSASPPTKVAPPTGVTSPKPADSPGGPVQSAQCPPLQRNEAIDYLAELTSVPPAERVAMTRGEARAIFADEANFIPEGWPGAYLNGWRQDAWIELEVVAGDGATLVRLQHGDWLSRRQSRFQMICDNGAWVMDRMGSESTWYAATPAKLEGQDGPLTTELAEEMLFDLLSHYGRHRMRALTTGNERERGRLWAVHLATGTRWSPADWGEIGSLRLLVQDESRVQAEIYDKAGVPSGERILFQFADGRWLIADHTEAGEWAPVKRPGFEEPWAITHEPSLMGLRLGVDPEDVGHLIPSENHGGRPSHLIAARWWSWVSGYRGISEVRTSTGSSARGLHVGDPISSALALYGNPTERREEALVYSDGHTVFEIGVVKDQEGVERVDWFRYAFANQMP